ncbi:tyrosine-protein phosphatase [Nocardioides ferulae]|uniref:tyrosine-protein phosphatase n=1 Tax=Nocardioides ferulae TaxID=2340821 RepID=UPI0013DE1543|nr:tyrosine-protein phosphatase [Nocardioides ferulae]
MSTHGPSDLLDDAEREHEFSEELVRLASADNFRDVAGPGPGYPTAGGGRVRTGVFYRSNGLRLTHHDATELGRLGITGLLDLRSAVEVEAHPDVAVPGAHWHHHEVPGIPLDDLAGLSDDDAADEVMRRVYRGFVADPGARAAFAGLFRHLAEAEGAQLFHCTAGKDRTGWAASLLLHLAGVDDDTILADYLLTNERSAGTRKKYLAMVAEGLGPEKVEVYERVLVADETFLAEAYAAVELAYGDRTAYLREGLGLDDEVLDALRAKLIG